MHKMICLFAAVPSLFCMQAQGAQAQSQSNTADASQNQSFIVPAGQSQPWSEERMRAALPTPLPVERDLQAPRKTPPKLEPKK